MQKEVAKAPATQIEDLFAFAEKKQEDALSDPFSMLLGAASGSASSSAQQSTSYPEESKGESATEVSGNGGGWDDDEDSIDID